MIVHHPFLIRLGPLEITGFGIGILLAFWIARVIMARELARRGPLTWAVIGTLVGAKLYYVLIITRDWHHLYSRAGFVFWGGFIGALVVTSWYVHRTRLGFSRVRDVAAIAIAAVYSVGRTGCWAIGDGLNRPVFPGDSVGWILRPPIGRPGLLRWRRSAGLRTPRAEDSRGGRAGAGC